MENLINSIKIDICNNIKRKQREPLIQERAKIITETIICEVERVLVEKEQEFRRLSSLNTYIEIHAARCDDHIQAIVATNLRKSLAGKLYVRFKPKKNIYRFYFFKDCSQNP